MLIHANMNLSSSLLCKIKIMFPVENGVKCTIDL